MAQLLSYAALDTARSLQESLMTGTVRIDKPGEKVLDPATDKYVTVPGAKVYEGAANVQSDVTATTLTVAGGDSVTVAPVIVKVPWDTTGILPGQVVTVLTTPTDPDLPGRVVYVKAANVNSFATCRRIVCTDNLDG